MVTVDVLHRTNERKIMVTLKTFSTNVIDKMYSMLMEKKVIFGIRIFNYSHYDKRLLDSASQ